MRDLVWEAAKRASKTESIKMSGLAREIGWTPGGLAKFLNTHKGGMDHVRRLGERLTELGILTPPATPGNTDQTPEIIEAAEALDVLQHVLLNADEPVRARLYIVRGVLERLEREVLGPAARDQKG